MSCILLGIGKLVCVINSEGSPDPVACCMTLLFTLGQDHLRHIFYRMGFDDKGIVALSGAHTLGRARKVRHWHKPFRLLR